MNAEKKIDSRRLQTEVPRFELNLAPEIIGTWRVVERILVWSVRPRDVTISGDDGGVRAGCESSFGQIIGRGG